MKGGVTPPDPPPVKRVPMEGSASETRTRFRCALTVPGYSRDRVAVVFIGSHFADQVCVVEVSDSGNYLCIQKIQAVLAEDTSVGVILRRSNAIISKSERTFGLLKGSALLTFLTRT